jgi:hypothetical protein
MRVSERLHMLARRKGVSAREMSIDWERRIGFDNEETDSSLENRA